MPKQTTTHHQTIYLTGSIQHIKLFRWGKRVKFGATKVNPDEFLAFLDVYKQAKCFHQVPKQFDFVLAADKDNYITFSRISSNVKDSRVIVKRIGNRNCNQSDCFTCVSEVKFAIYHYRYIPPTKSGRFSNCDCGKRDHSKCPDIPHQIALPHFPALLDRLNQKYLTSTKETLFQSDDSVSEDLYDSDPCYSDTYYSIPEESLANQFD